MTPELYLSKLDSIGWFSAMPDPAAARAAILKRARELEADGRPLCEAPVHLILTGDYEHEGDYEAELLKMADESHGIFKPTDILEFWGEEMRFRFVVGDHKFGVKRAAHEEFATAIFPSMALNAGRHVDGSVTLCPLPLDRDPYIAYVWTNDEALTAARRLGLIPWDEAMETVIRDILMVIADMPGMGHLAPDDRFAFDEYEDDDLPLDDWDLGDLEAEIHALVLDDPDAVEDDEDEDLEAEDDPDRYDPEREGTADLIDTEAIRKVFADDSEEDDALDAAADEDED